MDRSTNKRTIPSLFSYISRFVCSYNHNYTGFLWTRPEYSGKKEKLIDRLINRRYLFQSIGEIIQTFSRLWGSHSNNKMSQVTTACKDDTTRLKNCSKFPLFLVQPSSSRARGINKIHRIGRRERWLFCSSDER